MTTQTDRELLELAALASGLVGYKWDDEWQCMSKAIPEPISATGFVYSPWDPLKDDAAAFRLAVKLCIHVQLYEETGKVYAHTQESLGVGMDDLHSYQMGELMSEPFENDPYAATRRAITRAAAAIGQSMKEQGK